MAPKLFIIGGETEGETKQYEKSVAVLDIDTFKWTPRKHMKWFKGYSGGAMVGMKIYICGGCNLEAYEETCREMDVYNINTGKWRFLRKMPERLDSMGVGALNKFIYVSGGRNINEEAVSVVYRYDIKNDRWNKVKPMPHAKYGHHLVALSDYLYAVGGYFTKTVERYDYRTDTWTSLEETIFQHQCPGVTTYGGKIYVHGPEGFEVYTPATNTWASLTPAHNHFACSLVTVGNKIWSIGGNKPGEGACESVFQFDPATQRWSPLPDMPTPRQGHVSFVVNC